MRVSKYRDTTVFRLNLRGGADPVDPDLPEDSKPGVQYRRLFRGGHAQWAAAQALRMDGLMGCPDEVMLAIAEVANLAYWKSNCIRAGRLSIRELVRARCRARAYDLTRPWRAGAARGRD